MADKIAARPLPDTVILEVVVTDTSAERARDIAESLGSQFTGEVVELEADVSTSWRACPQ